MVSAAPAIGVVIPALNAAGTIGATLAALTEGRDRFQLDIVVADGGSTDNTVTVAEANGARTITTTPGRGEQLAAGAAAVSGDWLLFVHADTRLDDKWAAAVSEFIQAPQNAQHAGYFRLMFDDTAAAARRLERIVAWRARRFGLPYGDQGLLLSRQFYDSLGGFRPLPLMEDVDLVRRIGRRRLVVLPATAHTSAERYRRDGYLRRASRNLFCLSLYFLGLPPRMIQRLYG